MGSTRTACVSNQHAFLYARYYPSIVWAERSGRSTSEARSDHRVEVRGSCILMCSLHGSAGFESRQGFESTSNHIIFDRQTFVLAPTTRSAKIKMGILTS